MASSSRIVELASIISQETGKVDAYLTANQLPSPSFHFSAPPKLPLPNDIQASRDAVLEATDELTALMLGPVESLIPPPNSWICVTAIQRYQIASSFPPSETSTFDAIARTCSLSESDCRRLLRQAMTFYIFHEPSPGIVAHTAASKALAVIPPVSAFVGFISDEMLPASTRLVDAMQRWPGSEEPLETGFTLANLEGGAGEKGRSMFDVVSRDPRRAKQMRTAMSFLHSRPIESVKFLLDKFPWEGAIGTKTEGAGMTLVDIGGANGSVAMEIARHLPKMKCVVQDLPDVIEGVKVPEDLQTGGDERLRFMAHDFFEEQPVKEADIYLIRNVLHDWSDKYAAKILHNLIPALKRGARVLVSDICLPTSGSLSPYKARQARCSDLYMKGIQNAKERDSADWTQLFGSVDSKFKMQEIISPEGSYFSFICATWEGE